MPQPFSRLCFICASFVACTIMAFTTGCASGGFKFTRQYARFVNKQHIILRVILYLLTSIVFAVTMIIDLAINNTIDFWEGRVAQGTYEFSKDGKTYVAKHEVLPDTLLKRSSIQVLSQDYKLLQEVVLLETAAGEIEMTVDGKMRARVRDLSSLPIAAIYDTKGAVVENQFIFSEMTSSPSSRFYVSF